MKLVFDKKPVCWRRQVTRPREVRPLAAKKELNFCVVKRPSLATIKKLTSMK
jgi:hypothetical protein